jgi:hypothetical protein
LATALKPSANAFAGAFASVPASGVGFDGEVDVGVGAEDPFVSGVLGSGAADPPVASSLEHASVSQAA